MGLIIRSSSIHAAGCYTTSFIVRGTRVVEYTGPIIDKDEGDRRYEDKPITYLFGIGDGTQVIDGHGTAMFINHSCDANCETEEIDGHVWITAIRDIIAGEELCYDYCLYDGDEEEAPCNCGAATCRGSMFSLEELKRRSRVARNGAARPVSAKSNKHSAQKKRLKKSSSPQKKKRIQKAVKAKKKSPTAQPRKPSDSRTKREVKSSNKSSKKSRRG